MKGIRTFFHCRKGIYFNFDPGELAERSIAAVLKTVEVLQPPGVRIPNSPLHNLSYRKGGFFCVRFFLGRCGPLGKNCCGVMA